MKVSTFKSVGAKLFYYMSLLVLITVAGNSFQYVKTFMAYQTQQVQDQIQVQAERTASQFENAIDTWRSQITVALPTLHSVEAKDANEPLQRFVDSNGEFVAIQLYSAPDAKSTDLKMLGSAFTGNVTDKSFEDKVPSKIGEKLKTESIGWLKKQIVKMKKGNVAIDTVAKSVGLPIMMMATRFDVSGSQSVVWTVLATWQTNLIKTLPKSRFIDSAVIDNKGRVFTSPNLYDMINHRTFSSPALLKTALESNSPSGFEGEYRDLDGHRRLGAYSRLPRYDLTVLVEEDTEIAYQALKRNLLTTALWAALFILMAVMFSFFGAAGITKGLRAVTFATGRIASGDFRYQVPIGTKDEVGMLGLAVNHMSRRIVDLMRSQVDKARFEKELETAKMVQSTFFPRSDFKSPNIHVSGFYQPASECGGDLWGNFTLEDGVEFVFIADAMGHGAPAALVTAMAYSTTMTVADIIKHDPSFRESPAKVLERLNRIIHEAVRGTISMTFFASIVDTKRGKLIYANAGHNFPVVVPMKAGDPRSGKTSKHAAKHGGIQPISLKLMGTPLGMDPATVYKDQTLDLAAGDKIFYFTDGLIECTSPKGEVWGRKFLIEQITEAAQLGGEEMKDDIVGKAFKFFGNRPINDDVTIVVAEVSRDWVAMPYEEPPQVEEVAAPAPISVELSVPAAVPAAPQAQPIEFRMDIEPAEAPAAEANDGGGMSLDMGLDVAADMNLDIGLTPAEPLADPVSVAPTELNIPPKAPQAPQAPGGNKFKLKLPSTG